MKRIYVRPIKVEEKKEISKQDLVLMRNDKSMFIAMNWSKTTK